MKEVVYCLAEVVEAFIDFIVTLSSFVLIKCT